MDTPAVRRGRPGYDLESLLAVAVAVFNERGYDGTSMGDLSARLGITKSSIYHHVDSKEDLLALALDRALDGLFAVADQVAAEAEPSGPESHPTAGPSGPESHPTAGPSGPESHPTAGPSGPESHPTAGPSGPPAIDRLERLVRGSVLVLAERLPYVTLLLRARGNTATERRALARRRQFDDIVADLVKQAERDGDIRPDVDPTVTARLLFGMVNSLIEWYRPGRVIAAVGHPSGTENTVGHPSGTEGAADLADAVCAAAFDGLRIRH